MKKVVSLFLCLAMLFSMLVTTTMAEGSYNVTMETNETEVEAGETFTVTIKNKAMTVSSFVCGIFFDTSKLEIVSIEGGQEADRSNYYLVMKNPPVLGGPYVLPTAKPTVEESKVTGTVGFAWGGTANTEYNAATIATITFKVKENATGSANILLFEDSAGTNGAKIGNGYQTYEQAKDDNTLDKDVVTIVAPTLPVTGVTLNTNALSLDINGTAKLTATVQPDGASNKAVTFKSNNTAVATVDAEGNVTAKAEGQATITVTTADGGFTASCVVTVACAHTNKSVVEAQDSDCKTQGWDEHKKCDVCGQLFKADGTTEISEKPFRPLDYTKHTGGTATCTAKAICSICDQPYGDFAAHSFTAETKKAEALKSAGNCRDVAVYYYSCSACGAVENNDNHTFNGDKDATKHVGGTETVNAKAADHKNQKDGYTGDTKCLGCEKILEYGQPIPAGAHVESLTWTTDGTEHWRVCSVGGCGVEIDGTRATHYSNKAENKATCNAPAKCDACGVSYGQPLTHVPADTWSKDASGHWHECQNGCGEKLDFARHTPDHQGNATEEYAIKCKICDYVIEPMLNHEHKFDVKNATDNYKATDATCMKPATYYWACSCGEKSSDTYEYGEKNPDAHNWDSAWSGADNPDNHWHACLNGCGEKSDVTIHDYKMKFDSTKHWEECVCGRKINEGNHIDTDKNYVCDTCGSNMLRPGPSHFGHWDYNGDGRCDYCGAKTGCTHTDANGDGKCDSCSAAVKVQSSQTFDAGVLMYAGMAVLAATGSAAMIGKKRKEQ